MRPHAATKIRPDFVWLNGQVNVVKGQVFSGLTNIAEPCAMLRMSAELLRAERIDIPEVGAGLQLAQLTVVGQFESREQETTVKQHVSAILRKLNVNNRTLAGILFEKLKLPDTL